MNPHWIRFVLVPGLAAALLIAAWSAPARADEITLEARPDKTAVWPGEPIILRVTVTGANLAGVSEPTAPDLSPFQVQDRGTSSSSRTVIDGRGMTSEKSLTYTLQLVAQDAGTYKVGSFVVDTPQGKKKTRPFQIKVRDVGDRSGRGSGDGCRRYP